MATARVAGPTPEALGRAAARHEDILRTQLFGVAELTQFRVERYEVDAQGMAIPLPASA